MQTDTFHLDLPADRRELMRGEPQVRMCDVSGEQKAQNHYQYCTPRPISGRDLGQVKGM